ETSLAERWSTPAIAEKAILRTNDPRTGAFLIGRRKEEYPGLIIPYFQPGIDSPVEYQIRLDNPPMIRTSKGELKPGMRYLWPPRRGRLYFQPEVTSELLSDPSIPLIVTEGPLKALALYRLALLAQQNGNPRPFIVIALMGVTHG